MTVSVSRLEDIAIVEVDNPPVNALSQAVRSGLLSAVESCEADPQVSAVLLCCKGKTFIAGADVSEFDRLSLDPQLPEVVKRIETAAKPWFAALHGTVLGGGLEVAMACRQRFALRSTQLGLPEVKLGLIPGSGGTVRLPRLVGVPLAVDMCTRGAPIPAERALETGLLDAIVEGDLQQEALTLLRSAMQQPLPLPTLQRPVTQPEPDFWASAEAAVTRQAGRTEAPMRALASVRQGAELPAAEALDATRATFLELRGSAQARALRHIFFAERAATRPPELEGIQPRELGVAAVIGGGTMGAGIAVALRDAGLALTLIERDQASLDKGRARMRDIWQSAVAKGRISQQQADERLNGTVFSTSFTDAGRADLAIEAVFEDLAVKREVFAQLARHGKPGAILATNTSYLDPSLIFADVADSARCIGLHFFSPAHIMKLLEIVPIPGTAPEVLATGFALARRLGKIPVRAGICDGFIGNRILRVLREQAERLLLAGATPRDVDTAMRGFGMAMGPFEAQDLGGLDIAAFQRKAARARGESVFAPVADALCEQGRLGQKAGGGWHDYPDGSRKPVDAPQVLDTIAGLREGKTAQTLSNDVLVDAITLAMINEAAVILDEKIALRASDVDLVEVHGYGFPRWRGGLMQHAHETGLPRVVARLQELADAGLTPAPSAALRRLADAASGQGAS